MPDIKWIKLATDVFDNRKIRQIEAMPDGDALIVIWLKLLVLAGETNDGGAVYFTRDIPYTDQLLSTQFNRPLATIQLALQTFKRFGMIEIVNDVILVSNWERYQNIDGMEKVREQNRLRQKVWYDRHKAALPNVRPNADITQPNATEEEREEDKEREKEKEKDNETTTTTTMLFCSPAPVREESDGVVDNSAEYDQTMVLTVAKYFESEYGIASSLEEAEKFVAWNAAAGGKIKDWRKAADLWVARIKDHNKDGKGWMDL